MASPNTHAVQAFWQHPFDQDPEYNVRPCPRGSSGTPY
jgi:hypothetical protein